MLKDGTWKREIGKKDQMIALTTKLTEMQAKFDQQIASFATQAKKENTPTPASNLDGGSCCTNKQPYTVAAWHLVKRKTYQLLSLTKIIIGAPAIMAVVV